MCVCVCVCVWKQRASDEARTNASENGYLQMCVGNYNNVDFIRDFCRTLADTSVGAANKKRKTGGVCVCAYLCVSPSIIPIWLPIYLLDFCWIMHACKLKYACLYYVFGYIYVCTCVCVCARARVRACVVRVSEPACVRIVVAISLIIAVLAEMLGRPSTVGREHGSAGVAAAAGGGGGRGVSRPSGGASSGKKGGSSLYDMLESILGN